MDKTKPDELNVSWDDNIYKLIHTRCHKKHYHIDIKCHMMLSLNIVFSGPLSERNTVANTKLHCLTII